MTSKEAIQVLKNHNNRKYELVNKRRYAVSIIEQDLEVLEEIRSEYTVFKDGDDYFLRDGKNLYLISKKQYDKWVRWLDK